MIIPAHRVSLSNGLRMLSAAVTQPVVGFSIGLLGLIWAGAWVQIATEYKATLRDSMKETANIAIVFEQNVTRSVGEVDRLMLYLREAHARSGWATDWTSLLNGRYTADNQTLQISVANADGIVIASSLSGAALAKVDISDREHFAVHKRSSIDQLFVSKPLVGRASMKWSVQLTRRFLASDGRLGGVIVVTLDPSHFSRVYGEIELGTGSGLALVGTDDIIRAGTGIFQDEMGKGLKEAALTGRPLPAHNGTTIILDERDGHARVVGSRGVPGYPLFVVVGGGDISADPSLLKNRHNYMIGGGGLSLVVVLSMLAALQGRRRHEKEITYLARHDGLTNLANRALFREALDQVFCNAGEDRRVALHLLDLDRFKFVNDSYGHPVGDKLLIAVAERLRLNIRQSDLIARLGGDEFAVLQDNLTSYDYEEPRTLAERLCRVLSEPYEIDGICIEIGASIGIGMAPQDARNAGELVQASDLALYTAKGEGRNCHRFFNAAMNASAQARRALEADLKSAVGLDQLELHYQPIQDIRSGAVTAYEALVRWRHPERGMIPPLDFIPLAEETNLIIPIGAWVLQKACSDMASRSGDVKVAVNFSPIQFKNPRLVETVRSALQASGLAPHRLKVEITESTLMQRDSLTIKLLKELQSLGVTIAMDDFGTGYSSLSYLQSYPINCIKIDRSFTKTLGEANSATAIVRAITTLAAAMGMSTIAEGVETKAQFEELSALGCTEVQGYYISAPKPASEILPRSDVAPTLQCQAA